MINIRKSLFETNSSSTHAICIAKSNDNLNIPDELTFYAGEYGWENGVLDTTSERASYLYTALLCKYVKYNEKPTSYEMENVKDNLYELLGNYGCEATFVEPKVDEWGFYDYYIDHSWETEEFINKVMSSDKALLRYLFSPDSFVVTGNDNSDWFYEWEDEFKESEEYKKVDYYYKGN